MQLTRNHPSKSKGKTCKRLDVSVGDGRVDVGYVCWRSTLLDKTTISCRWLCRSWETGVPKEYCILHGWFSAAWDLRWRTTLIILVQRHFSLQLQKQEPLSTTFHRSVTVPVEVERWWPKTPAYLSFKTGSDSYDPNAVRKFIATFITSRRWGWVCVLYLDEYLI